MARKTPKQHQRHDEDSHDESLEMGEEPAFDTETWNKDNEAIRKGEEFARIEAARITARNMAFTECLRIIQAFADESDSHGTIWERVLTKRIEALL